MCCILDRFNHFFFLRLKKGRDGRVGHIEASIYQRAIGYEFLEETWEEKEVREKKDEKGVTHFTRALRLTKRIKKHAMPSDLACFFLLTNLAPDQYKHKGDWYEAP